MCDSVSLLDVLKNSRNEFSGEENTSELFTSVQEIMPLKPVDYKIQHVSGTVKKIKASINCTITSEEEMRIFIRNYTATSKETLRQLTPRKKKKHSLSAIVENNQPVAKKAGRHMSSKTRHFSVQKKDKKKSKRNE